LGLGLGGGLQLFDAVEAAVGSVVGLAVGGVAAFVGVLSASLCDLCGVGLLA